MALTQHYTRTITDEARDQSLAKIGGRPTAAWVREMWDTHFREPAVIPRLQVNEEEKQDSTSPELLAFLDSQVTHASELPSDEEIRAMPFNVQEPAAESEPESEPEPEPDSEPQVKEKQKQKKQAYTSPAPGVFLTSPVEDASQLPSDDEIRVAQFGLRASAAKSKPEPEPKPQVKERLKKEHKKPASTSPAPRTLHKGPIQNGSQLMPAAEMRAMHKGNDNPAICQDGATGGDGDARNKWREENNKKKRGRPRKDDAERSLKKARL